MQEKVFGPITRYSRAGRAGRDIKCPHCDHIGHVYHLAWSALTCQGCGKAVAKQDFLMEVRLKK